MKKLYIIIILMGLLTTSCSDFLDKVPSTSAPIETAISDMKDLGNAVNGIGYLLSRDRMTYSADLAIFADIRGEDFNATNTVNQIGVIGRYQVGKYDMEAYMAYATMYQALANINNILSVVDKVPYEAAEQATYNDLKGQLFAWRALLHFDLARVYCQIPTAANNIDAENSGLVLSTEVYDVDYIGSRSTLKQTYEQIITDFTTALPLLTKEKHNGYINYWAALALRAKVNLYYGKNTEALADAKEVMTSKLYSLYNTDNYVQAWGQEYTTESLFELSITSNYNAQRNAVGYYCDSEGYGECIFVESAPLYKYLSTHPEDIRSQLIKTQKGLKPNGEEYVFPGCYPAKYPGREGSLYINNPKIIRLAEVYLIAAEAALKAGESNAVTYYNDLRKTRIEGYQNVASITIDDILTERRYELFAENNFTFDMWRNKKSINNSNVGVINYDDFRTIFPIPQDEVDVSGGLLIQNPNY